MTYPAVPNFRTGNRGDAWWKYQDGSGNFQACQTQGLSLIKEAQRRIRDNGPLATTVFGAHLATRTDVTPDGIFGPASCKVLYSWLSSIAGSAHAATLADIEADFNANNQINSIGADVSRPGAALRRGTLQALIFAAHHSTGDLSRVEVQSTSVTPTWGVSPMQDGSFAGVKECWNPLTAQPPGGAGAGGTVTTTSTTTPTNTSTTSGTTTTSTSTMSTGTKVAIGVGLGLGALGLGAVAIAAGTSKRRGPRRRRPRQLGRGR